MSMHIGEIQSVPISAAKISGKRNKSIDHELIWKDVILNFHYSICMGCAMFKILRYRN